MPTYFNHIGSRAYTFCVTLTCLTRVVARAGNALEVPVMIKKIIFIVILMGLFVFADSGVELLVSIPFLPAASQNKPVDKKKEKQ